MANDKATNGLLVNNLYSPAINQNNATEIKDIFNSFAQSYNEKSEANSNEDWLIQEFVKNFPDKDINELRQYAADIVKTIEQQEALKKSLQEAEQNGRSSKYWLNQEIEKATSNMSEEEAIAFRTGIQSGLRDVNNKFSLINEVDAYASMQTNEQTQVNLEALESFYVNSFNENAKANGSIYQARIVQTTNEDNAINKEIHIVDSEGNICKKYDCVFVDSYKDVCENPDQAVADFAQRNGIDCESLDFRLEAPDGTSSDILPEYLKEEFLEPVSNDNIANRSTLAAMQGVMNKGYERAAELFTTEDGKINEYAAKIVENGVDTGAKVFAAGALKTASEKGYIEELPEGSSSTVTTIIADQAVSQFGINNDYAKGKITKTQALDATSKNVFCSLVGSFGCANGATIGATIGTVLGPVGSVLGGFIGAGIGFLAGFNIGDKYAEPLNNLRKNAQAAIANYAQKIPEKLQDLATATKSTIKNVTEYAGHLAKKGLSGIVNIASIVGSKICDGANAIANKVNLTNSIFSIIGNNTKEFANKTVQEIKDKVTS